MKTLKDVEDYFGGVPALAKALNIKPQSIYQWSGVVPRARAFELEHITNGEIKANELIVNEKSG